LREQQIADFFPKMNQLFEDAGVNVHVYNSGSQTYVVPQNSIQADLDLLGAKGATGDLVTSLVSDDPEYIHVLWLWTSSSQVIAVGSPAGRYIAIGDDPVSGSQLGEVRFAHEFGHVLGYDTHVFNDPTYLMNDGPMGSTLNQQQIQTIWASLNQETNLAHVSCDK